MPENNQILSVEGQLVGMPLAGPESFTTEQIAYLKRLMGLDETVLYDGSTAGSDGDITLSESMTNFERIGIFFSIGSAYDQGTYWYGGKWQFFETGDLSITKKFCISDNMNNGTSANTLNFKNQSYTVSNDNLTFTLVRSTQLYYNGSSWAVSTTAKSKIYKVVGIHRITGGN